jgi:hypothetical protein
LPPLRRRQPVQRSPALLRPPLLQRRGLRAPCSPEEQGGWRSSYAKSSSIVGAGLRLPAGSPPYPTSLRRPGQRDP